MILSSWLACRKDDFVVIFAIKNTSVTICFYHTSPEVQENIRLTSNNYSRYTLILQEVLTIKYPRNGGRRGTRTSDLVIISDAL
jgi:hypothetical protein